MKKIYFLTSLPRSGNTLLGAIINQNPNLNLTANSILPSLIGKMHLLKSTTIFNNFPDHDSLNNVTKNIFNNYYTNWKADFIIDRGLWGTPFNLQHLKYIIKKPKFIIMYRPVLECLASFIKIEKPIDVEKRCYQLMKNEEMIVKSLNSIKNLIKEKENYLKIYYSDFMNNPRGEIDKIYKFLNLDSFNHIFKNLNDFEINNIKYNDNIFDAPYHKIRTDRVEQIKFDVEEILPTNVIKKYSNLDIL